MIFNLILYGKNEFYKNLNNKKYHILVVDNNEKIEYMNKIFEEFNRYKDTIIGLDFEFRKISKQNREIALAQINLENNNTNAYIFIFYPPHLTNKKILLNLLCNNKIIKVLHGGESLDIPYLFNELFDNNKNIIKKFIINLYDTKFLCEYSHIINNVNKKCSIYNLLEEYKIIDQKNVKKLENLEKNMGKIYLVRFDINNLSEDLINYALYDVIYLPELIKKFIISSNSINKIISEFTGIIYYLKRVNEIDNLSKIVNQYNNNYILISNENVNLNEIFNYYYKNNPNNLLIKLSNITYFKHYIKNIIKYIIYKIICDKYKIKINLPKLNKYLLNNSNIINFINKNTFKK
jgi:hypothetical protein